jgi:DNA-binding NarL/FixJ family response regulator
MATELHELLSADYDIVEVVHDGAALIEAARRHLPDAIVSDIAMPGVNGLVAVLSILATRSDARIVFVTVQDSRAVIRKAFASGARGYVLKCDAGSELLAAVRMALQGGRYLSSTARDGVTVPDRWMPDVSRVQVVWTTEGAAGGRL